MSGSRLSSCLGLVLALFGGAAQAASTQRSSPDDPSAVAPVEGLESPREDVPIEVAPTEPAAESPATEVAPADVPAAEVAPAAPAEVVPAEVAPAPPAPVIVVEVVPPPPAAPAIAETAKAAPRPARGDDARRWRHSGFIVDLQLGTTGCLRRVCHGGEGHHAAPGAHFGGFVGANIAGILELGLEVGWNRLRPRDVVGRNAMTLYGIDPAKLQQAIADEHDIPASAIDLSTLDVTRASSRALDVGPSLRIHFIRKGRGLAYLGTGIHYQMWRNRYETASGDLRLDFHGVSIPLRVGGGAFVHRNIALMGDFTYSLGVYGIGAVHHPFFTSVAPLGQLQALTPGGGLNLAGGLPHFWTLSLTLRFRL